MVENQSTTPVPVQPVPAQSVAAQAEPFYKRHGLAFAISTLVLAVVVIFGMLGVGAFVVSSLVFHSAAVASRVVTDHGRGDSVLPGAPAEGDRPGTSDQGGSGSQNGRDERAPFAGAVVRGTITRIAGSAWTVESGDSTRVTVETTSSTDYGLPRASASASDFASGDAIIVLGTRSGDTVTASRIVKLDDLPLRSPSREGPSATPSPSATPGN